MFVTLKSKKQLHYAEAEFDGKSITVFKGAKINLIDAFPKMPKTIIDLRHNNTIVNEDGELLSDVIFNSLTAAAQFVTGRSVNGYIAWRPNDKMSMKEYLNKKQKE